MTRSTPPLLGPAELEFATFHEGYVSRYIQLADAKAGTALVVTVGTLGFLFGQDTFVAALQLRSHSLLIVLTYLAGLLLAVSSALSFHVIAPRGSKPGAGLVYFGDVARRSAAEFVDEVRSAGVDGIARERLEHAHAIAGICCRKYLWLRCALVSGALGLVAALVWRLAS
jgi:hypothetical protein